jgi:hypothetical protein
MTVDAAHVPTEAAILLFQWLHVHNIGDRPVDLQVIAIHNSNQVIESVVTGFHGGFPYLPFLLLTVTHDAKSLVGLAIQLPGQRDANRQTEALSQ